MVHKEGWKLKRWSQDMTTVHPAVDPILIRDTTPAPTYTTAKLFYFGRDSKSWIVFSPKRKAAYDHFDALFPLTGRTFALNSKARWSLVSIHKLNL